MRKIALGLPVRANGLNMACGELAVPREAKRGLVKFVPIVFYILEFLDRGH